MFEVRELGLLPYQEAWDIQKEIHSAIVAGESAPTLLLVEHPPVCLLYTSDAADE